MGAAPANKEVGASRLFLFSGLSAHTGCHAAQLLHPAS